MLPTHAESRPLLRTLLCQALLFTTLITPWCATQAESLESGFADPPREARLRAYWWWLNGNVTKAAITRDLEEMKAKGFGGALLCDAGGAEQDGNAPVPHGPTFLSPEWRTLYQFTVQEAERLGLELSLNIQSGWNLGGPTVKAEEAPKKLVWSQSSVEGPVLLERTLPEPAHAPELYKDLFVLAYPVKASGQPPRPIQALPQKALLQGFGWSAPDCSPLLNDAPGIAGEEDVRSLQVRDLTAQASRPGTVRWQVPAGRWELLRVGYTLNDHARVSTSSDGWKGFALDPIDGRAFQSYWQQVVEPLIADAGPRAGHTLKYLHTDSWEVEVLNWTPTLREEFQRRRGYDLVPFLPVLAGHIVDNRSLSGRFLHDFRKTIGDLAIDNHFRLFRDNAHRYGLAMHPESGGPHCVPIDSLRCLGMDDAPMSEFWARSGTHRVADTDRFFVKQPASAAHTYGRRLVLAEGFTDIGLHWQETLWDNLKPSFDRAACEGLNLLVWHAFVCSPAEMGLPGQQYFAGTHFNPNTTWWPVSDPFLAYLNRSQFLLQRGLFVADVCYYYGDHVPNFTQLKRSDPAKVLPGYDYDVVTEEVLLSRMATREGRLVLPDGMSYRLLVLPNYTRLSLPVLRKLKELAAGGATILGPKPLEPVSLENYPHCDQEFTQLADELWGKGGGASGTGGGGAERACGKGRTIWGRTARQVLQANGIAPDFEVTGGQPGALDYIHRREGDTEIYFIASSLNRWENFSCAFRVSGKMPELWLPDSGEIRHAPGFQQTAGRTVVPLRLEPYGSAFVVFRSPATVQIPTTSLNGQPVFAAGRAADFTNAVELCERDKQIFLQAATPGVYHLTDARNRQVQVTIPTLPAPRLLAGAWTLHAPLRPLDTSSTKPLALDTLQSWTAFADPALKYFSGTLQYSRELELSQFGPGQRLWLDLGEVHELAEVELNGRKLGILWKPPFRIELTSAAKAGKNHLVVRVTNFWPNRIIGDQFVPPAQRVTRTNIRKLTKDTPLMPSGLLGPVRLVSTAERSVSF